MPKESEAKEARKAPDLAKLREAARNSPLPESEMHSIAFSLFLDNVSGKDMITSKEQLANATEMVVKKTGVTEADAYKFLRQLHNMVSERTWGK